MKKDIVFINPGDRKVVFQGLGQDITAIEPPYMLLSVATYIKNLGYEVEVIDSNALNISPEETAQRVASLNPILVFIIVYGNQPSASTQNMSIAGKIASTIKQRASALIAMGGGPHTSALPKRTLEEEDIDFVIEGEMQISLDLLMKDLKSGSKDFSNVPGLWYYENSEIKHNPRAALAKDLDEIMPVCDWDLLPMPLYRAHNWHCFGDIEHRSPYVAIYTSLGCPYACEFCCINAPFGKSGIRYRSAEKVVQELKLVSEKYKVKNIKIIDELFVLHKEHYMKIVDLIIENKLDLNIWCYARVDTIEPSVLKRMKQAGINWLALGIESANPNVRDGARKMLKVKDIKERVQTIQDAGIKVIGNYIFGLPDDTLESMQETLDMAKELNCEFANFYCAMAYPGSKLYNIAVKEGWKLPEVWHGYSQHSYEMQPLPSKHLSAKQIVAFRDNAFNEYFTNPKYLDMLEAKFGKATREDMEQITKIKLKRRILEE